MKGFFLIIGLITSCFAFGQGSKTTDFLNEIQKYAISELWILKRFQPEEDTAYVKRQEPLGFIGDNYQRFQIHLISVIQNPANKLEYFVYGKTMVKGNICSFQGSITIAEASTYIEGDIPPLKQGFIKGDYKFFENPQQNGTGIFTGKFKSNFYIDKNGKMKYDALMYIADGFENNQFEGTWTSYQTKNSKKCNWGDYRIPECNWKNGCDMGAGEFSINDKYLKNGWENYKLARSTYPETSEVIRARQKENEQWWIDK